MPSSLLSSSNMERQHGQEAGPADSSTEAHLDLERRQAFGWPWGTTERLWGHTVPTCKDTQPDSEMPWDKGGGWEKCREGKKGGATDHVCRLKQSCSWTLPICLREFASYSSPATAWCLLTESSIAGKLLSPNRNTKNSNTSHVEREREASGFRHVLVKCS